MQLTNENNRTDYIQYIHLSIWIISINMMGALLSFATNTGISAWYSTLQRSSLTPPNYVFPIAWTILYTIIGICGWHIWRQPASENLQTIKNLYIMQLILNYSWTPIFFGAHYTGIAFIIIVLMDILVSMIIYLSHKIIPPINLSMMLKVRVSILMIPYLLWLLFASYLNYYIWIHN